VGPASAGHADRDLVDLVVRDVVAAADATGADAVGVLGFCMGGMFTLKAAGTGRFDGAVPFYGMIHVPEQWQQAGNADPLAAATAAEACPVLAIIGTEDPWTPAADVDELEARLAQQPQPFEIVRYAGAGHAFLNDTRPAMYRPEPAADAWRRLLAFLRSSIGA